MVPGFGCLWLCGLSLTLSLLGSLWVLRNHCHWGSPICDSCGQGGLCGLAVYQLPGLLWTHHWGDCTLAFPRQASSQLSLLHGPHLHGKCSCIFYPSKCRSAGYSQLSPPLFPFSSAQPLLAWTPLGWGANTSPICSSNSSHLGFSHGPLASNHRLKMRRQCSHLRPGVESKRKCWSIPPFPKTVFPLNLYNLDTFIPQVGVGHRAGELGSAPHLRQFCVGRVSLLTLQ